MKAYLPLVSTCIRLQVFVEQRSTVKITQLHIPDKEIVTTWTTRDTKLPTRLLERLEIYREGVGG